MASLAQLYDKTRSGEHEAALVTSYMNWLPGLLFRLLVAAVAAGSGGGKLLTKRFRDARHRVQATCCFGDACL